MIDYAYGSSSDREHLVPDLHLAAQAPWIGLTAFIGDEPHLIIGKVGEDSFLMEDQFGQIKKIDFIFPWEEPRVESNRLVAASRIPESPFKDVGYLYYDDETGEWAIRVGTSNMRYPLEEKIAVLEESGWSKFADLGGESPGEHSDHENPTIEVRAACPHCHSDQHLELLGDDEDEKHSGKEKTFACHNCGKWSFEHELEVSDHDKNDRDSNPEDITYEEHDDDASRHQQPEEEKEVHENEHEHHDFHDDENKKKSSSQPFTTQGKVLVPGTGSKLIAYGIAVLPETQGPEERNQALNQLREPHQQLQDFVKDKNKEHGTNFPIYDNPFINRGGKTGAEYDDKRNFLDFGHTPDQWDMLQQERNLPHEIIDREPRYPEHLQGDRVILIAKWLTPEHTMSVPLPKLSAIITGIGGELSHAVVVARGAGIPCIYLDEGSINRITPGDYISVDTRTGVVKVNGGDPNFVAQNPSSITSDDPIYRFAYANGHGYVEKMIPGQMVGELGGHGGMLGSLMSEGHVQMSEDFMNHNAALGFICDNGVILQDVNQIPDQEQFEQWIHNEESQLGIQPGPIKRLDVSAYMPGEGMAPTAKIAAVFEMPYPGGAGIHNGTSAAFAHAGIRATVTSPGLPQPIVLPFSAPNMFIMIKMFQAQGYLQPGQPIQVDSDNPELAKHIIEQQSGALTAAVNDDNDTSEPDHNTLDRTDKAITCPHCGGHTMETLSQDEDTGNAEFLCLSCDNTFKAEYRKHAAAEHPKGTRVEMVHPAKKGIKGSITDCVGTDDNFGDHLYDLILDNGDEMKKVPEIHFKKIKSASLIKEAPYGMPRDIGGDTPEIDEKMERCVKEVMAQGHDKEHAIRICKASQIKHHRKGALPGYPAQQATPNTGQAGDQPTPPCPHCGSQTVGTPNYYWCPSCGWTSDTSQVPQPNNPNNNVTPPNQTFHSHIKSSALIPGEWYTMYSENYKVPDVIQVVNVNEDGITAKIEGDDKGLFPIDLPHSEIEREGYKFEPYTSGLEDKTARRIFTVKEQQDLINENLEGRARNIHKLNLEGTHYNQNIEASVNPLEEEFWLW